MTCQSGCKRLPFFWAGIVTSAILAIGVGVYLSQPESFPQGAAVSGEAPPAEASAEEVHKLCAACHAYPPPESFPRSAWRKEVKQGYDFFHDSNLQMEYPSLEAVVQYYERRAPAALTITEPARPAGKAPFQWVPKTYSPPGTNAFPGVTNVNLVKLFDKQKLDILTCDAHLGQVLVLQSYTETPTWQVLGQVAAPAHAEVVDLDRDGIQDVLVANLGSFTVTDHKQGSVVWLRGSAAGKFTPVTILEHVGRVADAQAADFRGNGQLDVVVAVFGWRKTGEIVFLENQTKDWSQPRFVPRILDDRHGAVHVCVADLDADGKPDVVALISQEHEAVVAYMNQGNGRFVKQTLYEASHPAYGSSGIQLIDLNRDGKLDVLYSNGDSLDQSRILRPYHSVQWLENLGEGKFKHHHLTSMCGVSRAVAADFRGNGSYDIVAVSSLPPHEYPQRQALNLSSVIFLENVAPGRYLRHSIETATCDHFTCAVGDLLGNGQNQLVVGNFSMVKEHPIANAITIWTPVRP